MGPSELNRYYGNPGSSANYGCAGWKTRFDETGMLSRSHKIDQLSKLIEAKKMGCPVEIFSRR